MLVHALKACHNDNLPLVQSLPHTIGGDVLDARLGVIAIGDDADLGAGEADGGLPRAWMAMAMRAMEICSPVARSMSISRAGGCSLISRASSMSSSVVSPRALTTTMTSLPACLARMARRAAAMIRSAVATLLPPNFWTTEARYASPARSFVDTETMKA